MDESDLLGEIFVHAPNGEDVRVSLARLARAIRADGLGAFYSPLTVWHAYAHHPSLSQDYEKVMREYNERHSKKACEPR